VASLVRSFAPICLLSRPVTTSVIISRSRCVSDSYRPARAAQAAGGVPVGRSHGGQRVTGRQEEDRGSGRRGDSYSATPLRAGTEMGGEDTRVQRHANGSPDGVPSIAPMRCRRPALRAHGRCNRASWCYVIKLKTEAGGAPPHIAEPGQSAGKHPRPPCWCGGDGSRAGAAAS